jgi:putative methyltransferase (TIGR04325 family)
MPLRNWIPPAAILYAKQALGRTTLYGDFRSYADALAHSSQYETNVAFDTQHLAGPIHPQSWPLLSAVLGYGSCVLDFGGGVGRVYYELKPFLPAVEWRVVDLPQCVAAGTPDGQLSFSTKVGEFKPDVILIAGVTQYLPDPYSTLHTLCGLGAKAIAFNRTPVGRERFMVQRSYLSQGIGNTPFTVMDEGKFLSSMSAGYRPLAANDWGHAEGDLYGFRYMSYLFTRP